MKVLMIAFVYNEIRYLPHTIDYYKKNGCDIYIIDNYSTDGTYEWLIENKIQCHRVDTKESFDLRILSEEVISTINKIKPDWVLLGAADLYHIADIPLYDYIIKYDLLGFTQISMECLCALNTGELFNMPLSEHYYYALNNHYLTMITKYDETISLRGDTFYIKTPNIYISTDGVSINYGACKPPEEQEVKLIRTKKAHENGMSKWWNTHYEKWKLVNWLYPKEKAFDLRKSIYYKYILKINDEK